MSIVAKTLAAALMLAACTTEAASAQDSSLNCSKDKDHYSCDVLRFTKALKAAKTVAVESRPPDQISAKALENLARDLRKSIQPSPADLTFALVPTDFGGVYFGPGDRELATLRVFARGTQGEHGQLLWVESVVGQPDLAWLIVVHRAIQQFEAEFKQEVSR